MKTFQLSFVTTATICVLCAVIVIISYYQPERRFLPRCMECRRGLAMSVYLSVKRVHYDKTEERSVHHTKDHLAF